MQNTLLDLSLLFSLDSRSLSFLAFRSGVSLSFSRFSDFVNEFSRLTLRLLDSPPDSLFSVLMFEPEAGPAGVGSAGTVSVPVFLFVWRNKTNVTKELQIVSGVNVLIFLNVLIKGQIRNKN